MRNRHLTLPTYLFFLAAALIMALIVMLSPAPLTASAAPQAQILVTAEPCAPAVLEPTSSVVNARTGPGPNYAITAELFEGQSYSVAGRHHGFRWWLVGLPDGGTGWVWDNIVSVSGNVDAVPLLEAPPLNGTVPDTQDDWLPVSASPPCQAQPAATPETAPAPRSALAAQDDDTAQEGAWSAPANLSNSSGASNPSMIAQENGQFRVYWDDEFLGSFFVEGDHQSWSDPISATVPFSETVPLLLGQSAAAPLAFWVEEEDSTLLFSSAADSETTPDATWSMPQTLDDAILDYDAVLDSNGVVHLIYGRSTITATRSAGVYYLRSEDQGLTWSEPALLFDSPYFRTLRPQDAHVTLETTTDGGNVYLYAAWDVRSRKRVYFARSTNGGQSWDAPAEISGPESTSNIILPFNLRIGAAGSNVLLVWQIGQPAAACQQFYQWSTDHGSTWTSRQQLSDLLPGTASCPSENEILVGSDLFYLLSSFPQQVFLLAWNGERWSEPQAQRVLTQFNDPETLNTVNLGCIDTAVTAEDRLYVTGCDRIGLEVAQGDIWFVHRLLGTAAEWFPAPDVWSSPTTIAESVAIAEHATLASDNTGLTHALWTETQEESGEARMIFHSQWDGASWTQPAQILNSPASITGIYMATSSAADRVFLLWTTTAGDLYLTQTAAGQLQASTNWSPPEALPLLSAANSAPAVAVAATGTVYVVYAQSINEQRGVYLISSEDEGRTWSESTLLFDAQTSGWQVVGEPALLMADDGTLHLLFDQRQWTVGLESVSTGLYYMQCTETGTACTRPAVVAEGDIVWKGITVTDSSVIHRLWQTRTNGAFTLQHQASSDGGVNWGRMNTVASGVTAAPRVSNAVVAGSEGRLFAFGATDSMIQSWIWENDAWRLDETLERILAPGVRHGLAAAISQQEQLVVTFTDERPLPFVTAETADSSSQQFALFAANRLIDPSVVLPEATAPAEATAAATGSAAQASPTSPAQPTSDEMPAAEPQAGPSPSPATGLLPDDDSNGISIPFLDSSNPISFLLFSLVPVLLVVAVASIIALRRNWRRNR